MCREQTETMDVFEQLRWLAKEDANGVAKGVTDILKTLIGIKHWGEAATTVGIPAFWVREAFKQLETLANAYGGEKRAQELKQTMEDTMGL